MSLFTHFSSVSSVSTSFRSVVSVVRRVVLASALLAVPVIAIATPFDAQAKPGKGAKPPAGPAVTITATFDRFVLAPHGNIAGMYLRDGSYVHTPEWSVRDTSIKSGDVVSIVAHKKDFTVGSVYRHALVSKAGVVIADATKKPATKPAKKTGALTDLKVSSTVAGFIAGHKGSIHALVLSDGTIAHAGHKASFDGFGLKKGDAVTVTGKGGVFSLGRTLKTETVKLPNGDVKTL